MNCYNCGVELTEHDFCTNCGADVVHYKKVISVSNFYYNDGLEKANVRDLSGAIVSLTECLKLNKFNIDARNLLGLVYFEMGETCLLYTSIGEFIGVNPYSAMDCREVTMDAARSLRELGKSGKRDLPEGTDKDGWPFPYLHNPCLLYTSYNSADLPMKPFYCEL